MRGFVARLTTVSRKAIPYRNTLSHVNNFIINTTQFLNRFSYLCEEKLRNVSRDVQRLDIMLRILEEKLRSIPGIESAPAPADMPLAPVVVSAGESSVVKDAPVVAAAASAVPAAPAAPAVPAAPAAPAALAAQPDGEAVMEALPSAREDPRYAKYFKMLDLKIPLVQVQQKMTMDGVDPNILTQTIAPVALLAALGVSSPPSPPPFAQAAPAPEQGGWEASEQGHDELPPPSDMQAMVVAQPPPPPPPAAKESEDPLVAAVARRAKKMAETAQKSEGGGLPVVESRSAAADEPLPALPAINTSNRSSVVFDLDAQPPPLPRDDSFEDSVALPPPPLPPQFMPSPGGQDDEDEFDDDEDDSLADGPPKRGGGGAAPFAPPPPIARHTEEDEDDSF